MKNAKINYVHPCQQEVSICRYQPHHLLTNSLYSSQPTDHLPSLRPLACLSPANQPLKVGEKLSR